MKERGCADGRPQQEYVTKEESSSPTVSLYSLMGSCLKDAMDGRVITVNIPGAFLQGNWSQDDHPGYIMFEGIMVDMICEIEYHTMIRLYRARTVKRRSYTADSLRQYTEYYLELSPFITSYLDT